MKVRYLLIGVVVLFVAGLLTASSYAEIDPGTCVGMWLLDEDGGDTAEDSSLNENNGTIMNDPDWVVGKFGGALDLDGVDDRIEVPFNEALNLTTDLTIVAWVKVAAYTGNPQIVSKVGSGWEPFRVELTSSNTLLWASDDANNREGISANKPLGLDTWKHLAITYSNGETIFYVDGAEFAKVAAKTTLLKTTNAGLLFIGSRSASANYLEGLIDEVAIFNVALTAGDIQKIANKGLQEAINPTAVDLSGKLAATWANIKVR